LWKSSLTPKLPTPSICRWARSNHAYSAHRVC
jgi:hypothetical protein